MAGENANFYPRPPRGGRPFAGLTGRVLPDISIHALREEGDGEVKALENVIHLFLSTPSARRATITGYDVIQPKGISIHALREEGDSRIFSSFNL